MILLNYTNFCVLSFGNLLFYSFLFLMEKSHHQYQLLQRRSSTFAHFPRKMISTSCLNNVRAQLFPDRQFSLDFLMNIETSRFQQSIIFNLYCYI